MFHAQRYKVFTIPPGRSYLTRWYTEKYYGLKAANIVCATVCRAGAAAEDAIDIGVVEICCQNKKKTVNNL